MWANFIWPDEFSKLPESVLDELPSHIPMGPNVYMVRYNLDCRKFEFQIESPENLTANPNGKWISVYPEGSCFNYYNGPKEIYHSTKQMILVKPELLSCLNNIKFAKLDPNLSKINLIIHRSILVKTKN